MKNENSKIFIKMLCIMIILFFLLFICVSVLYFALQKEEEVTKEIEVSTVNNPETIEGVVEKHESTYLSTDGSKIYVNFKTDLYEENGNSNQSYFEDMIKDLIDLKIVGKKSFSLIDEEKDIKIIVSYNSVKNTHTVRYNNIENFYNVVDGESYSTVDKSQIIKKVNLIPIANELSSLIDGGMFFKSIRDSIGEGKELENGYVSYKDGKILLRMADYRVKNIIFTKDYTESVFYEIEVGTDLDEIANKFEGAFGGSADEGYIMYRTKDVYAFFYDDEIVVYGYSYFENKLFEEWLKTYLSEKDLKTFIENVTNNWTNYDVCEYDFDIQYAHVTYPSRGVEINIRDNNTLGITLYNNYYLTDTTKKFIKDGKISLNYKDDYLEITEKNRRENFER